MQETKNRHRRNPKTISGSPLRKCRPPLRLIHPTRFREQRHGVNIHISALINGYGEGRAVTKFVAETLADRIVNASDLESVLVSSGVEGASLVKDTAIDDQVR